MNANEQKPGQQIKVASKTRAAVKAVRVAQAASRAAVASRSRVSRSRSPGKVASRVVKARAASQISGKLGLCTAPPTSVGGFFARMREMDVRAHEQRLTEKDPYTCLDFFATEKRE